MPKTPGRDEKVTVTVRLPASVKRRLEEYAAKTKRTLGGYLELALEAQFAKDGLGKKVRGAGKEKESFSRPFPNDIPGGCQNLKKNGIRLPGGGVRLRPPQFVTGQDALSNRVPVRPLGS
jgi:hypothetical protein